MTAITNPIEFRLNNSVKQYGLHKVEFRISGKKIIIRCTPCTILDNFNINIKNSIMNMYLYSSIKEVNKKYGDSIIVHRINGKLLAFEDENNRKN